MDAVGLAHGQLVGGVSPDGHKLTRFDVPGADLQPDGDALQLPVVELPAGGVVLAIVALDPDAGLRKLGLVIFAGVVQPRSLVILQTDGDAARHNDNLKKSKDENYSTETNHGVVKIKVSTTEQFLKPIVSIKNNMIVSNIETW